MPYFTTPLGLAAISQAAGLGAPYNMSDLRGKTLYDSAGNPSTVPNTNIGLSFFQGKTFTPPVNNIIFSSVLLGTNTISADGKSYSTNLFGFSVSLSGGNSTPIWINVNVNPLNGVVFVFINGVNYGNTGGISVYFPNGLVSSTVGVSGGINGSSASITTSPKNSDQRTG